MLIEDDDQKYKKECLFSFNRMNKYYFFPFLIPIVCFSTKFFSEPMKNDDERIKYAQDITEENNHTFVFLYQMINSISLIFGGLLYFITIIRTKTENKANIGNNIFIEHINSNITKQRIKKNKFKEYLIIICMSIIITMYNILKGYETGYKTLEKRLYFLFFFTLINVYIFKKQIFKHQIVSLGLAGIGMAFIFVVFFVYLDFTRYKYIFDILLFLGAFLYSLYLVLVKYMSEKKYYSPFLLLLLIGIFSTIFTVIGYIIFSLSTKGDLRYITNIFSCRKDMYVCFGNYYFKIIMYLLLNIVLQVLIFLVCYYFSPEVFAISDIISPFLSFISKTIEKESTNIINIVFTSIGYIIIIFGSFIYNEIIVCNFWGLNENTWKAIDKKGEDEYLGESVKDTNSIGEYEITDIEESRKNTLQKMDTEMSMSTE